MPDDVELIPPILYSPLWLVLGIILVLAIGAWYLTVLLLRRRPEATSGPTPDIPSGIDALTRLKLENRARIDAVVADYARGEVATREANVRLSGIVRAFARAASGIDAPTMTLSELRGTPLRSVTYAVEEFYRGAFDQDETDSIDRAVTSARQVIDTWN